MQSEFDVILVGSGINGLVCATLAGRRGHRVCVLERDSQLGGCIRTDLLTQPGFLHDTLSGFHPLFATSPAYALLKNDLAGAGLEYCSNDRPTGVLMPDGTHAVLTTSRAGNVEHFNRLAPGDGDAFAAEMRALESSAALTFGLLGGELWSLSTARLLLREAWRFGPRGLAQYFGESMQSGRSWLDSRFRSDALKALLAPWVLHTGLGPDSAMSGFMARLIAFTLEAVGMPVVRGGSTQLVAAFRQIIERQGGVLLPSCDVTRIDVARGRACGVTLRDGRQFGARRAVVASVTPAQLYLSLLGSELVAEPLRQSARQYRFGRADMQIHIALREPPQWRQPALRDVVMVHLSGGTDAVARAVTEAECGLLPARPTIVVAQPTVVDPSRAPAGGAVLWVQLQELPSHVRGDAGGTVAIPSDGCWSSGLRAAYAARVLARLHEEIVNLDSAMVGQAVLSPADLEALNVNLVGGDPYAGACSLDQSFFWRPLRTTVRHETHITGLYHIGASTHPGPGLGGVSGYLVGQML